MEPLLGMPAGWLPRDTVQLDAYMRDMLLPAGRIVVSDTSRALARAVLYPPRVGPGLACVSRDAAAHDRVAATIDPPGLRIRVARALRAGVRALDDAPSNLAAAASAARPRMADGEASRSIRRSRSKPTPAEPTGTRKTTSRRSRLRDETVARHRGPGDGASGRRQERRWRRGAVVLDALRAAGRNRRAWSATTGTRWAGWWRLS